MACDLDFFFLNEYKDDRDASAPFTPWNGLMLYLTLPMHLHIYILILQRALINNQIMSTRSSHQFSTTLSFSNRKSVLLVF